MSMNDEQFEEAMKAFDDFFITNMTDDLRARDTAQREALARVEAERDKVSAVLSRVENERKNLQEQGGKLAVRWALAVNERKADQAQLAEALTLIRDAKEGLRTGPSYGWEDRLASQLGDFLARNAQAEQQEARNAEIARESLRPENQRIEPVEPLRVPHPLEAQGAQAGDERAAFEAATRQAAKEFGDEANDEGFERDASGEFAHRETMQLHRICQLYRAALATQPAAGEPVAEMISHPLGKQLIFLVNGEVELPVGTKLYKAAPPAAAHGDEMDRDEVQMQCLRDLYESGYNDGQNNPNGYSSISQREDAAQQTLREMRAQGDGGAA